MMTALNGDLVIKLLIKLPCGAVAYWTTDHACYLCSKCNAAIAYEKIDSPAGCPTGAIPVRREG